MTGFYVQRPSTAFSIDSRKRPRTRKTDHLAWIRTLPSLVPGTEPVEAAHIRFGEPRYAKPKTGMSTKPDDKWVVPLAADQHRAQHAMGERDWWAQRGIDPVLVAAFLWVHSGDDDAGIHIILHASELRAA
jgi:hypothetical protein